MRIVTDFLHKHPGLDTFIQKVMRDNITFLASAVSWTLLTSIVPIVVGLVGISSLFLRDTTSQRAVVDHLSYAMQGTLHPAEIEQLVTAMTQHRGLLFVIGMVGVLYGGSNVGGSFSTVFQPIFEVNGRDIVQEKILDVGMIFVFVALMVIIVVASSAGALVTHLFPIAPIPGGTAFLIGTPISLAAAFLLFAILYLVFPNTQPRFKLQHVWRGALLAAVLFQSLSFIWPLYAQINHFSRYGAVLAPLIVLAAWIYFFSLILMVGAEVVAFAAIKDANRRGQSVGPQPENFVPAHTMMREDVKGVKLS